MADSVHLVPDLLWLYDSARAPTNAESVIVTGVVVDDDLPRAADGPRNHGVASETD